MLRRTRGRILPGSISGPLPNLPAAEGPVNIDNASGTRETAKKISTSNLAQMIEQRTWENEQLRKELVYQQRKHGASVCLLEEVKLAVESLQNALKTFQQCHDDTEDI